MDIILTIIAVIVIFSLLILIHEYGHFIAARKAGVKVLEFGIGFPPRLFSKKIGETVYSINAIPFGGFVKLFGEDATDPELIKNKRSFAHMSPWTRTKIVCAGVFMNFILAIALLTSGFIFGIEPLLVTESDLMNHLTAGNITSEPGIFVAQVSDKTPASGLVKGDKILAIDDVPLLEASQATIFEKGKAQKDVDLVISRKGGAVQRIHVPLTGTEKDYAIRLKPYMHFPGVVIAEVKPASRSFQAGLIAGDTVLKINTTSIYEPEDVEKILTNAEDDVKYQILRNGMVFSITVGLTDMRRVAIADVFHPSAAEKSGFQKGDLVISIDGVRIKTPTQMQDILKAYPRKEMTYELLRNGKTIVLRSTTSEKNVLGVALSTVNSFQNRELSFYRGNVLTSVTEIKKVRYGPWRAFKQALFESIRLTGLTIQAFGRTLGSIFAKFTVPAEIGGPVQIAYYTHTFVREGFFALLRFTALLSLSLAVINVLPIPALDGGRLLFIVIEVIFRKRVNARFESLVHSIGFVLLLGLIALVTYSDIAKLF